MHLSIAIENPDKKLALFGSADKHLRALREAFGVQIVGRGDELHVTGEPGNVDRTVAALERMQRKLRRQDFLSTEDLSEAMRQAVVADEAGREGSIDVYARGHLVRPKTAGQAEYVQKMLSHDLTFCIGPAGSGKTYLAVAVAASLLKQGKVRRIVLARPAVEAGERLGFLPGDLQQKVNPYLRPLFDALNDMMDVEQVKRFMMNDIIEVIPLAFMRGRTLNEACIILDEAQNTTVSQMLMFLTRLGNESKMIVTGDISQIDIPDDVESGLIDATKRLKAVKGIAMTELSRQDIVRHRLVQNIVNAYSSSPEDE